jgi:hypothetical protein
MKLNSISINLVYCTENATTIIFKDSSGDTCYLYYQDFMQNFLYDYHIKAISKESESLI